MQIIKVGLVEDNNQLAKDIREKLARVGGTDLVWHVQSGKEMLRILQDENLPDVVLMDIQMPEMDGIEATREAKKHFPKLKVVMLTVMDDDQKLFEAMQAGASGYLLKEVDPKGLLRGIEDAVEGGLPLSPSIAVRVLNYLRERQPIEQSSPIQKAKVDLQLMLPLSPEDKLTKTQVLVLEHLTEGKNVRQIARDLDKTKGTIKKHLEHIYMKLQVHSGKEAIAKVLREKQKS